MKNYLYALLLFPVTVWAAAPDIDLSGKTIVTLVVVIIVAAIVFALLNLLVDRVPDKAMSPETKGWVKYVLLAIAILIVVAWLLKWIGWW